VAAIPSPSAPPESLARALKGIWSELPGLVSDRVELLALELRRAGQALARIVVLIVAAAILGVTAWVALWGCVVGGLVAMGLHWTVALLAVLLLNLTGLALAVSRMRALATCLELPATLRHLTLQPPRPVSPPAPAHAAATPPRHAAAS
jgi:hypothetical protein